MGRPPQPQFSGAPRRGRHLPYTECPARCTAPRAGVVSWLHLAISIVLHLNHTALHHCLISIRSNGIAERSNQAGTMYFLIKYRFIHSPHTRPLRRTVSSLEASPQSVRRIRLRREGAFPARDPPADKPNDADPLVVPGRTATPPSLARIAVQRSRLYPASMSYLG